MIEGIPYFGENNNEIYERILTGVKNGACKEKRYTTIYELIHKNIDNKLIVVIDEQWLTWLNDIRFNYRDHECYLPYFTYELYSVDGNRRRSDNKGHLLLKDGPYGKELFIRYDYKYEKLELNENNFRLKVYNLDTNEFMELCSDSWIDNTFDMKELYEKYVDSCFKNDDYLLNKHMGGYHYITRTVDKFVNKERLIRNDLGLRHYSEIDAYDSDYRDVRQYKYEQVVQMKGLRDSLSKLYKLRRLDFDCLIYCIMRENAIPYNCSDRFKIEWERLGTEEGKDYIKYGKDIKLIIKSYWKNEYKPWKLKSYSRFNLNNGEKREKGEGEEMKRT